MENNPEFVKIDLNYYIPKYIHSQSDKARNRWVDKTLKVLKSVPRDTVITVTYSHPYKGSNTSPEFMYPIRLKGNEYVASKKFSGLDSLRGSYEELARVLTGFWMEVIDVKFPSDDVKSVNIQKSVFKRKRADESMDRIEIKAIGESAIFEEVYPKSKIDDFIAHIPSDKQNKIKNIMNAVFKYMDSNGWTYIERGRPAKGRYKDSFEKIGGSDILDQLTWNLYMTIPANVKGRTSIDNIFLKDFRDMVISKGNSASGKYFLGATNNDMWEMINLSDGCAVGFGFPRNGSAYYLKYDKGIMEFRMAFKVVVPHYEKEKPVANNDANHKSIMNKVDSFIKGFDKVKITKAIDKAYEYITKLGGGYVEGKRTMTDGVTLNLSDHRWDTSNMVDCKAIYWKVELTDSSHYNFSANSFAEGISDDKLSRRVDIDRNTYYYAKVGNCFVGMSHTYGSRAKEYAYICVMIPMAQGESASDQFKAISNPFASSSGMSISNDLCYASYDRGGKSISGGDRTDPYNEPRFYTTGKKNLDSAWKDVLNEFNAKTTMGDLIDIIWKYSACHTWCAMD